MSSIYVKKNEGISENISRNIDNIRGLACIGVIYGHSIWGFNAPVELNAEFWVWIFLPISGYLVAKGFLSKKYSLNYAGCARFLWNRFLRIIPLTYLALSIGMILWVIKHNENPPIEFIKQFLFISPLNRMSLAGPLWSIAVEIKFYLISVIYLKILLYFYKIFDVISIFLILIGQILIFYYAYNILGDSPTAPTTLAGCLPLFSIGVIFAFMKPKKMYFAGFLQLSIVFFCISLAWYLNNYKDYLFWGWGEVKLVYGGGVVLSTILVASLLLIDKKSGANLAGRHFNPLSWCGFYCYGIYVWHSILPSVARLFFDPKPGIELLGIQFLAVLIAPLSYKYIEQPFLKFKSNSLPSS